MNGARLRPSRPLIPASQNPPTIASVPEEAAMSIRHRHPLHEGTEAAAIARLRRSLIRLQDETRLL